jgi:predicted RNA-binding protein associated with RNAse of E/G family
LFRRRFIPDETVELKNDQILFASSEHIITKWKTLKPRPDFSNGLSAYFINHGWKISKFFDDQQNCVYTYCDIIEVQEKPLENIILINDLLVDIIVYSNGFVKVVDISEIASALDKRLISLEMAKNALRITDNLLQIIYRGGFAEFTKYFGDYE